jgi:hypothetical protein
MSPSEEQVAPDPVQRPPWQLPEQQLALDVQRLPRVVQPAVPIVAHLFETQLFVQHSPGVVQAWLSDLHTPAEHLLLTQLPLQQSVEIVHVAPAIEQTP